MNKQYDLEQAAAYLNVSKDYVRRWVQESFAGSAGMSIEFIPHAVLERKKAKLNAVSLGARDALANLTSRYAMGY